MGCNIVHFVPVRVPRHKQDPSSNSAHASAIALSILESLENEGCEMSIIDGRERGVSFGDGFPDSHKVASIRWLRSAPLTFQSFCCLPNILTGIDNDLPPIVLTIRQLFLVTCHCKLYGISMACGALEVRCPHVSNVLRCCLGIL
jgi:hypothetical protein